MSDSQQLLTALTTEHFTLQGARQQTMSESSARASLFIVAVSSALVALGFIGQLSDVGDVFNVFALTVLPTLYVLGAVTFVRLVECGAEDFRYGMAINRIRGYYKQVAGERACLLGGAAVAVAVGAIFDAGLAVSAVAGGVAAVLSIVGWISFADRLLEAGALEFEPLFPSPGTPAGAD
jgi:hypothetical protein